MKKKLSKVRKQVFFEEQIKIRKRKEKVRRTYCKGESLFDLVGADG